ncbi:hypothetical protein C8Q74DRAFT_1278881 [Fomes fomentarius]|nr:hypothetical protein C8Q74DRAFT_1278881 [Fomes fomentarius]
MSGDAMETKRDAPSGSATCEASTLKEAGIPFAPMLAGVQVTDCAEVAWTSAWGAAKAMRASVARATKRAKRAMVKSYKDAGCVRRRESGEGAETGKRVRKGRKARRKRISFGQEVLYQAQGSVNSGESSRTSRNRGGMMAFVGRERTIKRSSGTDRAGRRCGSVDHDPALPPGPCAVDVVLSCKFIHKYGISRPKVFNVKATPEVSDNHMP